MNTETEQHIFALRAPKGFGRRKAYELLRAALEARGHDVTLSGDIGDASDSAPLVMALSANGGTYSYTAGEEMTPARRREILSASELGRGILAREEADTVTGGRHEGERWQVEQLRARGLPPQPEVTYSR
jgi:hypothetical protein